MKRRGIFLLAGLLAGYLGFFGAHLARFEGSDPTPVQVYPYNRRVYPPVDQDLLDRGIPYENPQGLSSLLEDYCS